MKKVWFLIVVMLYVLIIALLFYLNVSCAVWYPCKVVELKEEMYNKLIETDTTYQMHDKMENHIKGLYRWKIRKCNCYIKPHERY